MKSFLYAEMKTKHSCILACIWLVLPNLLYLRLEVPADNSLFSAASVLVLLKRNISSYTMGRDHPLITWDLIEKVTADAFTYGAAALGVPVKDTIKVTNAQGFATATPDRSTLWAVQTPQVFEKTSYLSAVKQAVQQKGRLYR